MLTCAVPVVGLVVTAIAFRYTERIAAICAATTAWIVVAVVWSLWRDFAAAVDVGSGGIAYASEVLGVAVGVDGVSLAAMAGASLAMALALTAGTHKKSLHKQLTPGMHPSRAARGLGLLSSLGLLGLVMALLSVRDALAYIVLLNIIPWVVWGVLATNSQAKVRPLVVTLALAAIVQAFALCVVAVEAFNASAGVGSFYFDALANISLPPTTGGLVLACGLFGGWLAAGIWPFDATFRTALADCDGPTSAILIGCLRILGLVALIRLLALTPTSLMMWTPHLGWIVGAGLLVAAARAYASADARDPRPTLAHLSTLGMGVLTLGVLTVTVHGIIGAAIGLCAHAWAFAGVHVGLRRRLGLCVFAVVAAGVPGLAVATSDFLIFVGSIQFGSTAVPAITWIVAGTLIAACTGALAWGRMCYRQLRRNEAQGAGVAWWWLAPALVGLVWLGLWPQWSIVRIAQSAHPINNQMYQQVCAQLYEPVTRSRQLDDVAPQVREACQNPYPPVQVWARGGWSE